MSEIISITFDGFELNNDKFKTTEFGPYGSPSKITKLYELARADGGIRVFERFGSKTINLSGMITAVDRFDLEDAFDQLKKQLRRKAGVLRIDYGNGYREWICTAKEVPIQRQRHNISFAPYQIVFESELPFSTDGNIDDLISSEVIEDSTARFSFPIQGTFDASPVLTLNFTSINPDESITNILIGNPATSEYISISQIFEAGDVLVIDSASTKAFLNGQLIKCSGLFPRWGADGTGILDYSDDATDREIVLSASAERRFL